jgi:hypothetical protein
MRASNRRTVWVSGLAVLLWAVFASVSYAQGLGALSSIAGGGSADVSSLADKQSALIKRLQSALAETLGAQAYFEKALGNKEKADQLQEVANALLKGNTDDDTINKGVALSTEADKEIASKLAAMKDLNAGQKQEIQNGLVPYARGTAQTVLIGKDFAEHLKNTQAAVAKASVANMAQIKSKLGTTLSVAPKIPDLGTSHVNTASTLVKIAKSNKLKTDEAEKLLGSL